MSPNRTTGEEPLASESVSRRSVLAGGVAGSLGLLGVATGSATAACSGSGDGSSPRPGPDLLWADATTAPQLENTGPWTADPILVCGTEAYDAGEYRYQGFLYDDHGANTTPGAEPPIPHPDSHAFGPMTGDVVYPTDVDTYKHNAADLVEFRARRKSGKEVSYRVTLNTMVEPDAAAVAIGIDRGGTGTDQWGYGIGSLGDLDLDHVLVTWGTGAELDGEPVDSRVDLDRHQIHVDVPLEPGEETWRHYLVVGLWDDANHQFTPVQDLPDETHPGGAHGQNPPPIFDVGFRFADQEPMGSPNVDETNLDEQLEEAEEERTGSRGIGYGHWREHAQANALAERDVSQFHADVDFGKVKRNATDYRVPETGYLNRIYASRHSFRGGGVGPMATSAGEDALRGRLVPYSLYVPDAYDGDPMPLNVHLHSLSGTYNQYAAWTPNYLRQIGDENGSMVLTTTGRGPGVPYRDQSELDVFESMADVRRNYAVDWSGVTLAGYSMGGLGTAKLGAQYPDLWAKAFPIVGALGDSVTDAAYVDNERIAENLRNLEMLIWAAAADELAPSALIAKYAAKLRDLGYRHEFDVFTAEHLTLGYLDEWEPARDWLAGATNETNPPQVTYRAVPAFDNEELGLVHDSAYWVTDVSVNADDGDGLVDVRSRAFGEAPPEVHEYASAGDEPLPHSKEGVFWEDPLLEPTAENALEIDLDGVDEVTFYVEEAAIDPDSPVRLTGTTSQAATMHLASSKGVHDVSVPAGEFDRTLTLCE